MNDLDTTLDDLDDLAIADMASLAASASVEGDMNDLTGTHALPKRPGIWRVTSMVAIVAAMLITAIAVMQARSAGDIQASQRPVVLLQRSTVTVTGLPVSANSEVAVLGLPAEDSRRGYTPGVEIEVPQDNASVIALYDGDALIGLSFVNAGAQPPVELSPRSTAEALVRLAPGVLRPDLGDTQIKMDVIANDPAFQTIVDAVTANSTLNQSNPELEQAYAELADRIPIEGAPPDQGCDSVADRAAYPAAGACVRPDGDGVIIANEQDRWMLLYDETSVSAADPCAIVAPTRQTGAELFIPSTQCAGQAMAVAAGTVNAATIDALTIEQVQTAAAVTALYEYAGPFADLVGASAGFSGSSVDHIRQNFRTIAESLDLLRSSNDEFAAAVSVAQQETTALDRHTAALAAARFIIDTADSTSLIPQRTPGEAGHFDLLGFYQRATERMIAPGTNLRWQSRSADLVTFGGDA